MGVVSKKRTKTVLTVLGLFALYVLGVLFRHEYGIRIVVTNQSSNAIQDASLNVESRGRRYAIGDIPAGQRRTLFVEPVTECEVTLGFTDPDGTRRIETVVGYAEQGYCGKASATILPNNTVQVEGLKDLVCWGSWVDFL